MNVKGSGASFSGVCLARLFKFWSWLLQPLLFMPSCMLNSSHARAVAEGSIDDAFTGPDVVGSIETRSSACMLQMKAYASVSKIILKRFLDFEK